MTKRDYGQFCGLASAMTIVGERWTLLLVRELLIGPSRFSDLAANLPGMGPNLLSDRLRMLKARGIVQDKPLPSDGRSSVYQLTDVGEQLREPVLHLASWGMQFLTEDQAVGEVRAAWGFLAIQSMARGDLASDIDEEYEFRVDDEVFHISVESGEVAFSRGPASRPAMVVNSDSEMFIRIGARMISPLDALATGALKIEGDAEAVQRCISLLQLD